MYSSTSALALALPVYGYHFNCGFAGSDILRSILVYSFFDRMLGFTRNSVILCQPLLGLPVVLVLITRCGCQT